MNFSGLGHDHSSIKENHWLAPANKLVSFNYCVSHTKLSITLLFFNKKQIILYIYTMFNIINTFLFILISFKYIYIMDHIKNEFL